MVLDRLVNRWSTLRVALKNNRVMVAKDTLTEIYGTEYAMQTGIDLLDRSGWGERLNNLMNAIAVLVEAEVSRFPDNVGHILGSRRRRRQSIAGHLTGLGAKARSAMSGEPAAAEVIGRAFAQPVGSKTLWRHALVLQHVQNEKNPPV